MSAAVAKKNVKVVCLARDVPNTIVLANSPSPQQRLQRRDVRDGKHILNLETQGSHLT